MEKKEMSSYAFKKLEELRDEVKLYAEECEDAPEIREAFLHIYRKIVQITNMEMKRDG